MIIPGYWAEASVKTIHSKKQITMRRFGWSEQSQEDAQRKLSLTYFQCFV